MSTAVEQSVPRLVLGDLLPGALIRDAVLVAGGAALVGLMAQVAIPLPGTPVPLTLQTLGVLLAGAALGRGRAVASMLLYLAAGACGLPWFAGHTSGASGPTLGYLIGFVVAAWFIGTLARKGGDRTVPRAACTMLLGTLVIYLAGVPWLMASVHVGLGTALLKGVAPFLPGDLIKLAVASGLLPTVWRLVSRADRGRGFGESHRS